MQKTQANQVALWVATCAMAVSGCGRGLDASATQTALRAPKPGRCERMLPGTGLARLSGARSSSSVSLAVSRGPTPSHFFAYAADADEPSLRTIDLDAGREIAVTPLRGRPEQ